MINSTTGAKCSFFSIQVNVQYIADFYSSNFEPSLANKFLLIPDLDKLKGASKAWLDGAQQSGLLNSLKNASERLLVPKEYTDFTGFSCDKIGVHYTAFRNQGSKCSQHFGRFVVVEFCDFNAFKMKIFTFGPVVS